MPERRRSRAGIVNLPNLARSERADTCPLGAPFVERLIGTVRQEFLDYVLFWNSRDLKRKLCDFQPYYNLLRVHAALDGDTPAGITGSETKKRAKLDDVRWTSHCHGLVQLPMAA